ncbi:MAG: bifunctional 4-hydroxy-2-oxoglutarate aldolase/2-dehydro-3-deoxy-phosphogluconate aldolase [Atribacterota bacterium]|nr:bifunctional 4-hydroxy-2-oxoglutarate aldolase/2-dehydro-3-deoxy-phosphogluconate aldolase [Atribacterota bacterium]
MNDTLNNIRELGIIPVVKIDKAEDAVPLGKALLAGDLPVAEITFRTSAAEDAIKTLTDKIPEILVGAGTVLTIEQAQKAVKAGAKFIVSPGFNSKIVDFCLENNIPVTPGVNSPTQIEMALEKGLEVVKFFPAEASGGLPLLKALSGPFSEMKFIPTGGIEQTNFLSYLAHPQVLACGGSWMVKPDFISSGNFNRITEITREAVSTMLGFQLAHLGINEENQEKALNCANLLSNTFYFTIKEGNSSIFAGTGFEIMKKKYLGEHGHIAIATNNISRAISYLKRKGISILPDTAKESNGQLKAIYLDIDVSGFALHLIQK